jgi:hypothetical protein
MPAWMRAPIPEPRLHQPGRWCTYDEAADMLGVSRGGVRNLARKRSWARRPGNDGRTRILVPADAVPTRTDAGIDAGTDGSTDASIEPASDAGAELRTMLARLEGELAGLRVVIESERRRADLAESLVAEVRSDRDRWHAEATARRSWWPWRRPA